MTAPAGTNFVNFAEIPVEGVELWHVPARFEDKWQLHDRLVDVERSRGSLSDTQEASA
jgi:hypothetical protein